MVTLLDARTVERLHDLALAELGGGLAGVLDAGRIEAAVARMSSGAGDDRFFPSLHEKAAALLASLIQGHPFVDGNKRTAVLAANTLLELNGWRLEFAAAEVVEFATGVATHRLDFDDIVRWLREHNQPAAG